MKRFIVFIFLMVFGIIYVISPYVLMFIIFHNSKMLEKKIMDVQYQVDVLTEKNEK